MRPDPPEAGRSASASDSSADDLATTRKVMDENWVVLRALALGDRYPHLEAHELLKMAEEQAPDHIKRSAP